MRIHAIGENIVFKATRLATDALRKFGYKAFSHLCERHVNKVIDLWHS